MNNFPSSYEFACGAVYRWQNNFYWGEIYSEHGVYHVRYGKNGEKWNIWKTYDNTIPGYFRVAKKKFKSIKKELENATVVNGA